MKFVVINRQDRTYWEFQTAAEVAMFLWGKDITHFVTYVRPEFHSASIQHIEDVLKAFAAFHPETNLCQKKY